MFFTNKKNKKPYIFYIDKDEKYQYLINESFKQTHNLKLLSSEDSAIYEIKNVTGKIDSIIISIDDFDFHKIINEFYLIKKQLPNIIFMTSKSDFFVLQKLMVNYSADSYIIKPFTKNGIIDCIKRTVSNNQSVSKQLIKNDKKLFDLFLDHLIAQQINVSDLNRVNIEPMEIQLKKLLFLFEKANLSNSEQSNEKNILFFDDKKESLNFYKQFVKEQTFNSFFLNDIETIKEVSKEIGIDLIIIDINELDDTRVDCLQYLIKSMFNQPDILVINSINVDESKINLMNSGVRVLLQKPLTNKKLIQMINEVLEFRVIRNTIKKELNVIT